MSYNVVVVYPCGKNSKMKRSPSEILVNWFGDPLTTLKRLGALFNYKQTRSKFQFKMAASRNQKFDKRSG